MIQWTDTPLRDIRTSERFGRDRAASLVTEAKNRLVRELPSMEPRPGLSWHEFDSRRSVTVTTENRDFYASASLADHDAVSAYMQAARRAGHAPDTTVTGSGVVLTSRVEGPSLEEMDVTSVDMENVYVALRSVGFRTASHSFRSMEEVLNERYAISRRRLDLLDLDGHSTPEAERKVQAMPAAHRAWIKYLHEQPARLSYVSHGDLNPSNVFMERGRVVFIDPEPHFGSPTFDLVKLAYWLDREDLLDTYVLRSPELEWARVSEEGFLSASILTKARQ